MPALTMRHLEFCQNKFRCETASSGNKVAEGAAECAAAHEDGCRAELRLALSGKLYQGLQHCGRPSVLGENLSWEWCIINLTVHQYDS